MDREELNHWLRLCTTPGVGPATARKLLKALGLPSAIWGQSHTTLSQLVNASQANALSREPEDLAALTEDTCNWLLTPPGPDGVPAGRCILTLGDPDYPASLLQLEDPPLMLYLVGRTDLMSTAFQSDRLLAMVGSRNPTPQGIINARDFAYSLTQAGLTIVSGMALGIDGAAHEGALDALQDQGLATIAFVGTGIDRVYPKAHHTLARRIASQGLLISECPLGTPPLAANFPKRNRLIAAVSSGTLVVEAAMQSGSLITARLAADMGREVFAIPGSIHAPQARGCHALIRQGAKLVEAAQDVLEELHIQPVHERRLTPITHPEDSESPIDTELLRALGFDPVSLDALQARTGQPTALLQAELMTLELDGEVTRLPGGLYQRLARA
ncbi:MAG: DNA-protecting protein DprA [Betaproteobacteria bacterium]|nr:DNA-protecting protein DprA [Betaproteobacteria bacterium]